MMARLQSGFFAALVAVLGVFPAIAPAQVSSIQMEVEPGFLGLGGAVRGGSFAPLRLSLRNQGAEPREVICRWLLEDYDGDEVIAERRATLNPARDQHVWLYAVPSVNVGDRPNWNLEVIDAETGELLVGRRAPVPNRLAVNTAAIGIMGSADMGLRPYANYYTQHEPLALVEGLEFDRLPDRWYGLDMVGKLIWTRLGGSPNDPGVTAAIQAAVRDWVRRGGHLVIVLPEVGEPWSGSPLADLMPVTPAQMRRVEGPPPKFLYDRAPPEAITIGMTVFDRLEETGAAVVQRDAQGNAIVVAGRYGFGRVTVVGVDLANPRLVRLGMPEGAYRIWHTIFGWNAPIILKEAAEALIQQGEMSDPTFRPSRELGVFIPPIIGMTGTAGPALLGAILLFALYFAATPLSFVFLRQRSRAHRAWPVFVVVVLAFTAVTWGGAWLMRPQATSIAHFSVVDVDGRTGEARTQSWLSVYVPDFGASEIRVGDEENGGSDVLWSAGLFNTLDDAGFPDRESYRVDAGAPHEMATPMRSTAKQFQVHYLGRLTESQPGLPTPWVMPQGTIRLENAWPSGALQHDLPGTLRDVLLVYVPPSGTFDAMPWVWRIGDWPAMTPLQLGPPRRADRLVKRPPNYAAERQWASEGYLGDAVSRVGGHALADLTQHADPLHVTVAADQRTYMIELLSFYDALPPPDYARANFSIQGSPPVNYHRSLGRDLDLTHLTVGGRVILLGQLEDSPLPAPLTVDGDAPPSRGRTVVRWIYDL